MKRIALLLGAALAAPASAQQATDPSLEFVFEEIVELGEATQVGDTGRGGRLIIPITGGTFEGPDLKGEVMPGGWDWQLRRPDGCTDIEADYFLKTDDGAVINVVNVGVVCPPDANGVARPTRTHPVFEPPRGKYEWLGQTAFIGTLEMATGHPVPAVKIRFFRVN